MEQKKIMSPSRRKRYLLLFVLVAVLIVCGSIYWETARRFEEAPSMAAPYRAEISEPAIPDAMAQLSALGYSSAGSPGRRESSQPMAPPPANGASSASLATMDASQIDRYLIKDASLTVETEDVRAACTELVKHVRNANGYVADLQEVSDGLGRRSITVQVRIPANTFDTTVGQLDTLGDVLHKQVKTQDVTEQYVDTDARVRNLKCTDERLLAHLNRSAAFEDIIKVENELTRVREQIEQNEGRLRFLSHRIAFSTLTVSLREKAKAESFVPSQSFSSAQVASRAIRSLLQFVQSVWTLVIWVGVWSPVWIPGLVVLHFLCKRVRRVIL